MSFFEIIDSCLGRKPEPAAAAKKNPGDYDFELRLEGVEAAMESRYEANECPVLSVRNFVVRAFLSGGVFGNVMLVERIRTTRLYALKTSTKNRVEDAPNLRVIDEKRLTYAVDCQFIVELHYVFQDSKFFYLFLDHAQYGSVHHCMAKTRFTVATIKWYAAQVILAVEYLHQCNIMHRDIKPANMLIFKDFHLKLGDMGLAKIVKTETYSFAGTRVYMAPEIKKGEPYGKFIDWWSVGISLYHMMYLEVPFDPDQLDGELTFPKRSIDPRSPFCDLVRSLLEPKCTKRLGCLNGGVKGILEHEWFNDISFPDVYAKKLDFRPKLPMEEPLSDLSGKPIKVYKDDADAKWYDSFCPRPETDQKQLKPQEGKTG